MLKPGLSIGNLRGLEIKSLTNKAGRCCLVRDATLCSRAGSIMERWAMYLPICVTHA